MNTLNQNGGSVVPAWIVALVLVTVLTAVTAAVAVLNPLEARSQSFTPVGNVNEQVITLEGFETEIRLAQLRFGSLGQNPDDIDKTALLTRIVLETLILQSAEEAGVRVGGDDLSGQIDIILVEFNVTRPELVERLQDLSLTWEEFENSVIQFLTIRQFVDEELLSTIPPNQQEVYLRVWAADRILSSDISFDPQFLDSIGASASHPVLGGNP